MFSKSSHSFLGRRWSQELEKSQVIVITYTVFVDIIQKNLLQMNQINLLILDDCHNVMNDDTLKSILSFYESSPSNPRILGLTASIVNSVCKPLELSQLIIILEKKLRSSIQTSNNILSALQ